MSALLLYLARRFAALAFVLLAITTVVFVLIRVVLPDPASALLPSLFYSEEAAAPIREKLGLDASLPTQYVHFLGAAVQGDFGTSYRLQESAAQAVLERVPATLALAGAALLLAMLIAIPLGVWAAHRRESAFDRGVVATISLLQATPSFWLAVMFVYLFSIKLALVPALGRGTASSWILPVTVLALSLVPIQAGITRSGMLDALREPYILLARAKGLPERRTLWKHAFSATLPPLVTIVGLQLGYLIAGTVVVEVVFNWDGVGQLLIEAIRNRDFPVIQAVTIMSAAFFVALNAIIELTYALLDPRVRRAGSVR